MLLIVRIHFDLIISRESIHQRHPLKPTRVVDHDIRDWKGKLSFRTRLIYITKINANPNLLIFLGNGDDIGYSIRVLFLPDETRVYKLFYFRLDCFHDFWTKSSLLLLDRFRIRIDVETMHNHLRIKPRHILVVPREYIYILSHKRYLLRG